MMTMDVPQPSFYEKTTESSKSLLELNNFYCLLHVFESSNGHSQSTFKEIFYVRIAEFIYWYQDPLKLSLNLNVAFCTALTKFYLQFCIFA